MRQDSLALLILALQPEMPVMAKAKHQTDMQIYGRLLTYVTPYWAAFVLSIFGYMIYAVANVSFLTLLGYIVDSLGGTDPLAGSQSALYIRDLFGGDGELNRTIIPIAIVLIVFGRGIGTFVGNYFISYVGTNLVHGLRVELFDRLLLLPSKFYDKNAMGHLVTKVTFHVSQVTGAATDAVKVLIREGLTVIFYMGLLFLLNWKLTLIFICVAPFIGLLVNFAGKRFRRISERIQDSMGDVTHVASEAVQGYREVRTFGGLDYERERFLKVSHNNRRQSMKMVITASIATPAVQLVVSGALAGLVWLALDPMLLANMSSGDVVQFIGTGGLLAKPIRQLTEINSTIQRGLAAAEDIFAMFDEEIEQDEGTKLLSKVKGKLEFRDVSFSYDDNEAVVKNISFIAEPGETIALVGKSGSGKSTLASLIPRFYSPQTGQILLDDVPVEEIKLSNLREHMAIVTQDVTLFNDTIARNIAYGSLHGKDDARIQSAAEKAYAWDFISELDEGLNTAVGDDGVLLSGGQRQRLAIARAFLKDAPILILDEATSALDSESERYIQSALEAVSAGRTTIIIAHRLSTIEKADRILVIDKGKLVEQGTHAELLEVGSHYAGLHNIQVQDQGAARPEKERGAFKPIVVQSDQALNWLPDDFNPLVTGWYNKTSWTRLLSPLSWVFTKVSTLRRHRIKPWHSPVPVIVVGNINVGGTGKTPLVVWIAEQLEANGHKPGIVSRGYGGKSRQYPLAVNRYSDTAEAGDESVMLARKTECPIVVDPDRCRAVQYLLEEYDCDVVISDDGLQHYALGREVEIAVVDAKRGLGNGLCLPAGPLREPPARLAEVDIVVVNGDAKIDLTVPYMRMLIEVNGILRLSESIGESAKPEGLTVHGVAGIGHPERFFDTLKQLGYEVIEHRFDDHHLFKLTDLTFGDSLPVIMTEKDAVKCRQLGTDQIHHNFWYVDVSVAPDENFLPKLLSKIGFNSQELKPNPVRKV
ncbi:MAG: subfamily B ATP-binding cassette protein MsbA [Candidatus Azotimanducaceae bacterium]|jgi:subfamily B ATP-binding cassette protein MsbA